MAENRIQNSLTNRAPGISPQASLLRISAAATPPPSTNPFFDLAGSLDTINPSIGQFMAKRELRGKTDAEKKADLEAVRLASEGQLKVTNDQLLEYVDKGVIKKAHLPVFQDRLRFRLGTTMAAGLQSDLYEQMKSTTSAEGRVDPTALSNKAIADGLEQFPVDDLQGRTGYLRAAQDIQARFVRDSETLYTQAYTEHGEALQAEELSTVMARMADGEDVTTDLTKWDSVFVEEGGNLTDRRRFYEAASKTTIERLLSDDRFDDAMDFVDQLYSINLAKGVPLVTKAMDNYLFKVADTIESAQFQAQFKDSKEALALDDKERTDGKLAAVEALNQNPGAKKMDLMALADQFSGSKRRAFVDAIESESRIQSDQSTLAELRRGLVAGNLDGAMDRIAAAEAAEMLSPSDAVDLERGYNRIQTALFSLEESVGTALRFVKMQDGFPVNGDVADWLSFELPNPDTDSAQQTISAEDWMASQFDLSDQVAVSDGFNAWVKSQLQQEAAAIADQLGTEAYDEKAVKDSIYKKLAAKAPGQTKSLIANQVRVVRDRKQRATAQRFTELAQLQDARNEIISSIPTETLTFPVDAPVVDQTREEANAFRKASIADAFRHLFTFQSLRDKSYEQAMRELTIRRVDALPEGHPKRIKLQKLLNRQDAAAKDAGADLPEVKFSPKDIADVSVELIQQVLAEGASAKEVLSGATKGGVHLDPKNLGAAFPVFTIQELMKETKDGWSDVFLAVNASINPGGDPMDLYIAQLANPRKEIDAK